MQTKKSRVDFIVSNERIELFSKFRTMKMKNDLTNQLLPERVFYFAVRLETNKAEKLIAFGLLYI
jgi:hypothetical protein